MADMTSATGCREFSAVNSPSVGRPRCDVTMTLAPEVPRHIPVVAESGIFTREDVLRVGDAGVRGVLVGESLMRADDPVGRIRALLGKGPLS